VGQHRAFHEPEIRFSLQTCDGAVERDKDAHIREQEHVFLWLKPPFPTYHFQCLLHIHRRRSGFFFFKPVVSQPPAQTGKNERKTYTEMVVYRCAASAVSWILIRRKIWGPDELYELGKTALLSVEGGRALVLLLLLGAVTEGGASVPLDESAFLVLATREGLR
jgi:hypothetical protein